MSVVHVIPAGVFSNTYHGSYKDTISRVRYLENCGQEYRQICLDVDDPCHVLKYIEPGTRPSFLIEYSSFPNVVRTLRQQFPNAFIAVRSHNLEPLQHFDNYGWWPPKGPLWLTYGMARLFRGDLICKKYASVIWSISDWENRVYWNRLPGRAAVEWLPYSCPEHLLPTSRTPLEQRHRIACMPTSQKNRKSWDLVTRFMAFADQMKEQSGNTFDFVITGNVPNWGLPMTPAVSFSGMINDLRSFLQTVRAVAMLSDKGYGFKTTIGDAIANGASVLAHPTLARRCPDELSRAIIPVESNNSLDVAKVLAQLEQQSSFEYLDTDLRNRSHAFLTHLSLSDSRGFVTRNASCDKTNAGSIRPTGVHSDRQ